MIAALMLYMTLTGALIAVAAWLAERACVRLGLARRWCWCVAAVSMCVAPLLPSSLLPREDVWIGTRATGTLVDDPTVPATPPPAVHDRSMGEHMAVVLGTVAVQAQRADGVLLGLWGASSAGMLLVAMGGVRRLRRARRGWWLWRPARFSSPAIWLSDEVGPAAFGAVQGEIVLPRWAMTLPQADRKLLLQHERAHVHAGDPRLVALGQALVIAVPWLMPLRVAFRRLQRAVEHDCDRRVLQRPMMVRRYADLLLHVAERGLDAPRWAQRVLASATAPAGSTALLSAEHMLEARLRALVRPTVTWQARARALGGGALASVITTLACTVPLPRLATVHVAPLPRRTPAAAPGMAVRDPAWVVRARATTGAGDRTVRDSLWFAWTDSLVIDAITRSNPALLRVAQTRSRYLAVTLTADNQVLTHSVRPDVATPAGAPLLSDVERHLELRAAGVPVTPESERSYERLMREIADEPSEAMDSLGVSHLLVDDHPLTVLWIRLKSAVRG